MSVVEETHFYVEWRVSRIPGACGNPDPHEEAGIVKQIVSAGFPLPAFCASRTTARGRFDPTEASQGLMLRTPGRLGLGMIESREFPATPSWPGFAANSIFYGALLGALWFAGGVVRLRRRASRGQCVSCGYEARGLQICPECGSHIAPTGKSGEGSGAEVFQ
jgi:hypothetical protein